MNLGKFMPAKDNKLQDLINLLPKDDYQDSLSGRILHWLLNTFRVMVILVEFVVIIGFLSRFFLDTRNSDLTDEINQKKDLIASYLPFERSFKLTQAQLSAFEGTVSGVVPFSEIVATISQKVPSTISLDSINVTPTSVDLMVSSNSENSLALFVDALSQDPLFDNVYVSHIESKEDTSFVVTTIKMQVIRQTITEGGNQSGS